MYNNFRIEEASLGDVKIITPFYCEDSRGYFLKSYEKDILNECNILGDITEDFESYSYQNVIRGLHFQTLNPQIKIVRAVRGSIIDVVVDLRKDSATFTKWISFELTDENRKAILVPAGFAHGFRVISKNALVSYKCIGKYMKEYDSGIKWNDKDLNITWGIKEPIISERDNQLMSLKKFLNKFGGIE